MHQNAFLTQKFIGLFRKVVFPKTIQTIQKQFQAIQVVFHFLVSRHISSPGTLFMHKDRRSDCYGLWKTGTFCADNEATPTTIQKKENMCESENDTATISNKKRVYVR